MEHNFKWKNDGRTKVMIGCGTRPEIIRLAAVIKRCREYFDCCIQNPLKPVYKLVLAARESGELARRFSGSEFREERELHKSTGKRINKHEKN